jgi:hypothetical protein
MFQDRDVQNLRKGASRGKPLLQVLIGTELEQNSSSNFEMKTKWPPNELRITVQKFHNAAQAMSGESATVERLNL